MPSFYDDYLVGASIANASNIVQQFACHVRMIGVVRMKETISRSGKGHVQVQTSDHLSTIWCYYITHSNYPEIYHRVAVYCPVLEASSSTCNILQNISSFKIHLALSEKSGLLIAHATFDDARASPPLQPPPPPPLYISPRPIVITIQVNITLMRLYNIFLFLYISTQPLSLYHSTSFSISPGLS
jgi:hypothetical protein